MKFFGTVFYVPNQYTGLQNTLATSLGMSDVHK